jgi:hypothetical protein
VLRIGREPVRGATLRVHADKAIVKIGRSVPDFELVESGSLEVAGRPAILMRFRLTQDGRSLEQTLVLVDPLQDPDRCVAVFNASGPPERSAEVREMLDAVLRSVRFRTGAAAHPGVLPASTEPSDTRARGSVPDAPSVPMPGYPVRKS